MPIRRRLKRLKAPALTAWTSLGLQASEMMLASAQVINHRLTRMATAKLPLSARDSAEFLHMGSEKVAAAAEAMIALSTGVMAAQPAPVLVRKTMKPFHGRATANAKRLGKIKH